MVKSALISILLLFSTAGCSWLAAYPKVEADLKKEGVDIARDTEQVIEDLINPNEAISPAAESTATEQETQSQPNPQNP